MLPYKRRRRYRPTRWWHWLCVALGIAVVAPVFLAEVFAFLPVPLTPLMVIRLFEGESLHKTWVPLSQISPAVPRAVLAAEDTRFCQHAGFDWKALNTAYAAWQAAQDNPNAKRKRPLKGGSTISQQTAKNVFLWPGRTIIRKGLEAPLTVLIENLWGKRRILEVYLNVAEWGPGVYGIEAAARHHFDTSAKNLTARQAAQLAAVLPSPRTWNAGKPGPYIRRRAASIQGRSYQMGPATGPLLGCLRR